MVLIGCRDRIVAFHFDFVVITSHQVWDFVRGWYGLLHAIAASAA